MNKLYLMANNGKINDKAPVIARQEIVIDAPIDKVWDILVDIGEWPEWYTGAAIRRRPKKLEANRCFYWKHDGVWIKSRLVKVEKPNILTWVGRVSWLKSIQVWQFQAMGPKKTKVKVDASLDGAWISRFTTSEKQNKKLNLWLNLLKIRVEKKYPNPQPPRTPRVRQTAPRYLHNVLRGINQI